MYKRGKLEKKFKNSIYFERIVESQKLQHTLSKFYVYINMQGEAVQQPSNFLHCCHLTHYSTVLKT